MPTPDHLTTDAKVAVLIAEGLEEIEALAVVDLLYRAGIAVDMLAVGDDAATPSWPPPTCPTTPSSSCRAASPAPSTSRAPGR